MSIFNKDIVSSSLLVSNIYDVSLEFERFTDTLLIPHIIYSWVYEKNLERASYRFVDKFTSVTMDQLNLWLKEQESGLNRDLRRHLKKLIKKKYLWGWKIETLQTVGDDLPRQILISIPTQLRDRHYNKYGDGSDVSPYYFHIRFDKR